MPPTTPQDAHHDATMNPIDHRGYRWVLVIVGVLLVVIVVIGIVVYASRNRPVVQPPLTTVQKQTLVTQLNQISEEHPLTPSERLALIKGKVPTSSSSSASTASSVKSSKK